LEEKTMMRIIRMLLAAVTGLLLLQGELPAQSSGFVFEDATNTVGFIDQNNQQQYIVKLFDTHITGAAFVDLTGDGYPDLVLPAKRQGGLTKPINQTLGGLLLVENKEDPNDPTKRFFDFSTSQTIFPAHETVGVVAFDYDNDGDLDLLMICTGDQGPGDPTNFSAVVTGLSKRPADPMRNVLLRNDGFGSGPFPVFSDVTAETDPKASTFSPNDITARAGLADGWGLAFTQAPSSLKKAPGSMGPDDPWVEDVTQTTFPRSSACAAVADVNRDGLLDVFIGNGPPGDFDRGLTGQMDALYLNGGPDENGNWIFWDVTYDRTQYPGFYAYPDAADDLCPGVHWKGYIPVFGSQDENGNFIMPQGEPWLRFSATIAAAFTDLNNDGWPDLIVTNKGFGGKSVFFDSTQDTTGKPWTKFLGQTLVYINRGNDAQGKWLGFWPRTWDLLLQQDPMALQLFYKKDLAPMGIALGDYDANGLNDYLVSGLSYDENQLDNLGIGDSNTQIHMGALAQINRTGVGDLSLESNGNDLIPQTGNDAPSQNLHGDTFFVAIWYSWGLLFGDFDNDGDLDIYACCKKGEGTMGTLKLPKGLKGTNKGVFDRFFENQLLQDPTVFGPNGDLSMQMKDLNPAPYAPTLACPTAQGSLCPDATLRQGSRNVRAADFDLDGFLDLLILPPAEINSIGESRVRFFRNVTGSETGAQPGIRIFLEDPNNVCPLCNRFAVGARVLVRANLDGNASNGFEKQYAELHVGEGNGASTNSYPLEFGLGAHDPDPMADGDFTVKVTWPCGFTQTKPFDLTAIRNQPLPDTGLVRITPEAHIHNATLYSITFQTPDQADPAYPAGLNPLVVPVTVSGSLNYPGMPPIPANVPAVELSLRKAGTTDAFRPFSMAHGRPDGVHLEPQVIPLRLSSEHDSMDLPMDTYYEVKVRSRGPSGEAKEAKSDPADPATQLLVKPYRIDGNSAGCDWTFSDPHTVIVNPDGSISLPPGEWAEVTVTFPGATDFVAYDAVVSLNSDLDNGEITFSMAKLNMASTPYGIDAGMNMNNFGSGDQLVAPPSFSFGDAIRLENTGGQSPNTVATQVVLHSVTFARRP